MICTNFLLLDSKIVVFVANIDLEINFIGLKLDFVGCDLIGSRPYAHYRLVTETRQYKKRNILNNTFNSIRFPFPIKFIHILFLFIIIYLLIYWEPTENWDRQLGGNRGTFNTIHATFLSSRFFYLFEKHVCNTLLSYYVIKNMSDRNSILVFLTIY